MLQALTTPLFKSVVLGGVLLATGIGAAMTSGHPAHARRLVLDAPVVRGDIYLSAWDNAELRVRADRPIPLCFETAAWISDGCHWVGMETLEKLDDHTYSTATTSATVTAPRTRVRIARRRASARSRSSTNNHSGSTNVAVSSSNSEQLLFAAAERAASVEQKRGCRPGSRRRW